jgi:hypothetical protein
VRMIIAATHWLGDGDVTTSMCQLVVKWVPRMSMTVREMSIRDAAFLLGAIGLTAAARAFANHRDSRLAADFARIHVGLSDVEKRYEGNRGTRPPTDSKPRMSTAPGDYSSIDESLPTLTAVGHGRAA